MKTLNQACVECCPWYPPWGKWLSFIFVMLGFLLFVVGFSSQYWYYLDDPVLGESHSGLWRTCSMFFGTQICTDYVNTETEDFFKVVQAFETIALLFLIAGFVTLIVYLFFEQTKITYFLTLGFLIFGVICILIGLIVYGVESEETVIDNIGFSFYFVTVSAGLVLIGAVLFSFL